MHSSRMCTVRCSSRLRGGVCPGECLSVCLAGVHPQAETPLDPEATPPARPPPPQWTEFLTHAVADGKKNILLS